MGTKTFYYLLISVLIFSCGSKEFDSEAELWEYISDPNNCYFLEKSVRGYDYSLLHKPTDLIVAETLGRSGDNDDLDSLRSAYEEYAYFTLSMSRSNQEILNAVAGNRERFGSLVNTLAFDMGNNIHLISETRDTIAMLDFVYPRMYGMSKSTDILLVYPKEAIKDYNELKLSINEIGLGTGDVTMKISAECITKEVSLKF